MVRRFDGWTYVRPLRLFGTAAAKRGDEIRGVAYLRDSYLRHILVVQGCFVWDQWAHRRTYGFAVEKRESNPID